MRLRAAKVELSEMGEDTEGMAESTASLRAEMLALTGIDLMENETTFKSTYKFLEELSQKWGDINDIQRATVIELAAGKHHGNTFSSLMENFNIAQDALKVSLDSEGSGLRELSRWQESLEARILKLKASWQSFAQTFMSSDFLKGGIDTLTKLVDILDALIDNVGVLGTAGLGIAGKGVFDYFKHFKSGAVDTVEVVTDVVDAVSNVSDVFESVVSASDIADYTAGFVDTADAVNDVTDAFEVMIDAADMGDYVVGFTDTADAVGDVVKSAGNGAEAMADLDNAVKKTNGGFKAFMKTPMGIASAIGVAVAAIALLINHIRNVKEEQSKLRQETIQSSDEFLNASLSFEKAYIKYSGKTNLTSEEESELAAAIDGTVEALGDKASALQNTVNASSDYVSYLEEIARKEREAAESAARNKRDEAKLELQDTVKGWSSFDGSEVDVKLQTVFPGDTINEATKIAQKIGRNYLIDNSNGKDNVKDEWYLKINADADANEIVKYYDTLLEIQNKLSESGLEESDEWKNVNAQIVKLEDSVKTYTDGVYQAAKAQHVLSEGIPKTTEDYIKMREAVLSNEDVKQWSLDRKIEVVNTLDSQYKDSFDLTSAYAQSRKLVGVINKYDNKQAGKVETFLNMRTAVNNNECTVGEYVSQFNDIEGMTKDWTDKEKEEFNLAFGIDTDKVKTQYDEMLKTLKRGMSEDAAKEFLDGLTASEVSAAISLKGEVDWENGDPSEIITKIREEAKKQEALTFTVDIAIEKEKLDNLATALSESFSGTGLSTEGVSIVESMFSDLDSYDPSKIFERTANGIRLNTDEYRRLNNEYGKTNIAALNKKMSALGDEYNKTREELYGLTYGTEEYQNKTRDLSDIESKIKALETLSSQYEGLASAYNQWQMAESAGSHRDMYETVIEGWETVGDEISRGWFDDGTIEFLELLTGRTDLAGMSARELKKVYKDLDNTIEGTNHSVRDFFTVDEEGNSTSKGVYNFLEAVEDVTGKVDVIKRDEKGKIVGFDFQLYGGDEAIAKALGVSEELVQIMKRAADDAGFVVSLDGTYQQLDVLKEKAQTAAESLNKTLKESGKKGFNFNFNTTEVEDIKKQLTEAEKILNDFRNTDGTINMELDGAEEALTVASTLQSMLDKLTRPAYMNIEVSQVEKEIQEPLKNLQELRTLTEAEHQLKLSGADTSELEKSKQEIYEYFENLDPEVKAELGLVDENDKPLTGDALKKKLESGDLTIEATVDIQMEMDEKLGILVDKALLEAGIIDEEEFEKRVKIYLKADEVDTSDVEEKTDKALNGESSNKSNGNKKIKKKKSVVERTVDIKTYTNSVDTSDTDKKTDNAINGKGDKSNKSNKKKSVVEKPVDVKTYTNSIDTSDTDKKTKNVINNTGNKKSVVEKSVDIKTYTDTIDTSKSEEEIDKAKEKLKKRISEEVKTPYSTEKIEVAVDFLANTDEIDNYTPEQLNAIVEFIANTDDIESYTPEQKQALVEFFANTTEPDGYTPEEKQAIVDYLSNTRDPDNYTPEEKQAIARFIKNSEDPDKYQVDPKTGLVTFGKDSSVPDNYKAPTPPPPIVIYKKDSSEVDSYNPRNIIRTVTYKLKQAVSNGAKAGKKALQDRYLSPVNGTANVNGTTGCAFKQGSWGTKDSGTALVGELGTEILVRDGRYYTIGDNGAEFIKYKRGDIIFNHVQSEELFKNGKVTSGGGRAKAFVNGTAFYNGTDPYDPESEKKSYAVDRNPKKSSSENKFEDSIDWLETKISRLERTIDRLDTKANSVYRSWSERNKNLVQEIAEVGNEISLQEQAYNYYIKKANSVGLSSSYAEKVRNGSISVEYFEGEADEKTVEKIKLYEEYYQKALDCKDAVLDLQEEEYALYTQKFDNIVSRYEGVLDNIEHQKSMIEEYMSQYEGSVLSDYVAHDANSYQQIANYYQQLVKKEQLSIVQLEKEKAELIKALDEAVENGLSKTSEKYQELMSQINDIDLQVAQSNTSIIGHGNSISETYVNAFNDTAQSFENMLSTIEHKKNMIEEGIAQSEAQGHLISEEYYNSLIDNEVETISKLQEEKAALLSSLETAMAEGGIEKYSNEWYAMCQEINNVTLAIEQSNTALLEYQQTLQQLDWEKFDLLQDRISAITEESDFLIELMSNKKLFDDEGNLTNEGKSTIGLHGVNYNTYMHQADLTAQEIVRVKAQLASDPYDTELEEHYRELISLQQQYILNAEDEKNAIKSLVEEGIQLEIEALEEKIDLYKNGLNSAKDLYDYQKRVEKESAEIASLQKQISAYQGDDSEESKKTVQELKVALEEAEDNLESTEFDRYIENISSLLDSLAIQYEETLNQRLDNIDYLVEQVIADINANAGVIGSTITEAAGDVGYTLSDSMRTIWDESTVSINGVVSMYGEDFKNNQTSVKGVIDDIKEGVDSMVKELGNIAQQKIEEAKESAAEDTPQANYGNDGDKSNNESNGNKDTVIETPTTNEPKKETPKTGTGNGKPEIGDAVTFKSGQYYYSSDGLEPKGSALLGKTVYITRINNRSWAKKPYHIARDKAGSRPLGWLSLSQISGYAFGKKNFLDDEVAWTQEDGQEFIVRPSDGAILTPVAKGDSVLTSAASNNIWDMANSPSEFIKDNLNVGSTNTPNNSNVQSSYVQNLDKVVFNFPNVKNYDEMLSAMQKDKKFQNLIQAMTINQVAGKSQLYVGKALR